MTPRLEPGPIALPCACANLRRAARAVTQRYDAALRPAGLRATQFTLLQVLERAGGLTQGVLGTVLATDSTTLSRTLQPLEAAGWVRSTAGADRRLRHVALTAAGRRKLAQATPRWEKVQRRLRDRLGGPRWQALLDLLQTTAQVVGRR